MTKKSSKNKLTESLKSTIRTEFVQGLEQDTGDRKVFTLDELIKKHNVASATLYRTARKEGWKAQREQFEYQLQEELNEKRIKSLGQVGIDLDDEFIEMSKDIIKQVKYYFNINQQAMSVKSKTLKPSELLALCNGLITAQKLGKIALGETTENINVTSTVKEADAFRSIMELLDDAKERIITSDSRTLQ
tara:strand:+ start:163 stop:732 length:570 start_codon:yes stop_codon:yes gene_type:complete